MGKSLYVLKYDVSVWSVVGRKILFANVIVSKNCFFLFFFFETF